MEGGFIIGVRDFIKRALLLFQLRAGDGRRFVLVSWMSRMCRTHQGRHGA